MTLSYNNNIGQVWTRTDEIMNKQVKGWNCWCRSMNNGVDFLKFDHRN